MHDDVRTLLQARDLADKIAAIQTACRERRVDLLPDLLQLLRSDEVGYFVEECLPAFGAPVIPALKALLRDSFTSDVARVRASAILAYFGDYDSVPVLLEAIERPDVNQSYFHRLVKLAPDQLSSRLQAVLQKNIEVASTTREPHLVDYFAKLMLTLTDLGKQQDIVVALEHILRYGRHWHVQGAAAEALYRLNPEQYSSMIQQVADSAEKDNRKILLGVLKRLAS